MTLIGPDLTVSLKMKEFPRRLKTILQSFNLLMRSEMFFFFSFFSFEGLLEFMRLGHDANQLVAVVAYFEKFIT